MSSLIGVSTKKSNKIHLVKNGEHYTKCGLETWDTPLFRGFYEKYNDIQKNRCDRDVYVFHKHPTMKFVHKIDRKTICNKCRVLAW